MNKPSIPKTNIYSFDASHIESMLAANNWNGCWEYLGQVIETLTITASTEAQVLGIKIQRDMDDEDRKQYVNNFGALLGELFMFLLTDPNTTLSDTSFENLIFYHETLHTLFYIYNIDNTDTAVLNILGDGKHKLSSSQQKKLLLLLSMDTELDIVTILKNMDTKYRLAAIVSYQAHRKIFRKNIYNNKIKLYELRNDLDRAASNLKVLSNFITVYFICSYLNFIQKHLIKENINTAARSFLVSSSRNFNRIKNIPSDQSQFTLDKSKPTILVFAELFARNHAMFRCYGGRAISLMSEFNVILVMPSDKADYSLEKDFKNYVVFKQVGELYKIIHDAKPDIIYMPSVGMCFYTVLISAMRWAPIQIMSLGHPATSMSDNIDYVMGPSDLYNEKAFPKDTYIGDGPARSFLPLLSKEEFFAPSIQKMERTANVIKIAVVGSDTKVSYPFFKLLKDIVEASPFEIHVSFLMGVGGIDSLYIEKYLKENFKNSTYHGWQTYKSYIETIKTVDIVLNPFPFGHTNTIIDTLMCGKPCIGMNGIEPASKTEAHVLRAVGLADQFVANDEDDYKKKFFAIADRILKGDTVFFDREEVYRNIFTSSIDGDYGKVMKWVYDNHTNLKASGKKYFEMFEPI